MKNHLVKFLFEMVDLITTISVPEHGRGGVSDMRATRIKQHSLEAQPGQARGLSCPVRSQEAEDLPLVHLKTYVIDGSHTSPGTTVDLCQVFYLNGAWFMLSSLLQRYKS